MWYLAIDFGTTASTGSVAEGGRVTNLQVNGQNRVPSAVLLDEHGHLVAGLAAVNQAGMFPDRVDRTPKESLGGIAPLLLGGEPVAVDRAVGEVIRVFVDEAVRQHQGEPPVKVVLTHPARWADTRKQALMAAAATAGVSNVELCPEPVAAAVHYAEDRVAPGAYVGVYDFGGGTFDTAVLRRTADGFEWVGDAGGDEDIGGEDLDFKLYELVGELLAADDPDLWTQIAESDERRWRRANHELQEQVRRAKEALSTYPTTRVPVPNSDRDVLVTREQFEHLIADEIAATVDEMARTITAAGLQARDLDLLYLAGGSSRIPLVQRRMTERFGNRVSTYADPKLVVSMGAARWIGERYGVLSGPGATPATPTPSPTPTPVTTAAPPPTPPPVTASTPAPTSPPGLDKPLGPPAAAPAPAAGPAPAAAPPTWSPPTPGASPPSAPAAAPAPQGFPPVGHPGPAPGAGPVEPNRNAVLSVFSASLFLFLIPSVVAIVLSRKAKAEISASGGRQGGSGLAQLGLIGGIAGIVVFLLLTVGAATA